MIPGAPCEGVGSPLRSPHESAQEAAGFVLAGGASSRMGEDKALLLLAGRPLVQHAVCLLRETGLQVSIAGAGSRALAEFAPIIDDRKPGLGPLAGICAALDVTAARYAVFLPIDLPLLAPSLITYLIHRARVSGQAVNLITMNGFTQTFPAVLERTARPFLERELEAGRAGCFSAFQAAAAAMGQTISRTAVEYLAQSGQIAHPRALPPFLWFLNLNHRADLAEAEALFTQTIG